MMLLVPPLMHSFPPANNRYFLPSFTPPQRHHRRRLIISSSSSKSDEVDAFTQYSGYLFELKSSEPLINEYDISKIASVYQKKPLILLRRLFQLATTFGKWFALRYYDGLTDQADSMFQVSFTGG